LIPVVRTMAIDAEPLLKAPATADEHENEGSTGVAGQERHVSGDDLHGVAALAAAQIQRLARGVAARVRVRQVRLARDEVCAPSKHGLLYPRNPTRATEDLTMASAARHVFLQEWRRTNCPRALKMVKAAADSVEVEWLMPGQGRRNNRGVVPWRSADAAPGCFEERPAPAHSVLHLFVPARL